ncbi:hypothetical protein RIEGSTA812A_PEG_1038 [invertebrate metagenome]|uniref:Uncharacterized protein n=1 Tax=invertebrate metagenome TaxID=1711999 RepID=A0A484H7S9_9ZZZZ
MKWATALAAFDGGISMGDGRVVEVVTGPRHDVRPLRGGGRGLRSSLKAVPPHVIISPTPTPGLRGEST